MTVADPDNPAQPSTTSSSTVTDALLTVVRDRQITRNAALLMSLILGTTLLLAVIVGVVLALVGVWPAVTAASALGGVSGGGVLLHHRARRQKSRGERLAGPRH